MINSAHLVLKKAKQRRRRALKVTINLFLEKLAVLCRPWSEVAIRKPEIRLFRNLRGQMFTAVTKQKINEV